MPEFITFGETMAVMAPTEKGALKYVSGFDLRMAGAESNTAIGLSKLGHSTGWMSALGEDAFGEYVLSAIRGEGVDVSAVKLDGEHRTGLMVKELRSEETSVYYYRDGSAASHFRKEDIDKEYVESGKIVHITGITPLLSDDCREAVEYLADLAKKSGKLLSFDPNIRKKLWGDRDYGDMIRSLMFMSDIVLIGRDEGRVLLGTDDVGEIIEKLRAHGVRYIAVKDGGNGAWCADEKEIVSIPPEPCKPIDPIGAGDGFNAGFLCGILEGRELFEAGRMGAIAGAMATESTGDVEGYPTKKQMAQRLEKKKEIYR